MGAMQRRKGANGEREVVHVFESAGIEADRTAPMQAGANGYGDVATAVPGIFLEVKRQERLNVPAWLRKLEEDCPEDLIPVLIFRQSRDTWRAVVPLEWLAGLLAERALTASREESPAG